MRQCVVGVVALGARDTARVNPSAVILTARMVSTSSASDASADSSGRTPASKSAKPEGDLKSAARLASLRKGTGYRSSFSGMVATVFGANGLLGRGVCNRLGKIGTQMILPYRGEHYPFMRLKVCGDLGQLLFHPYHLKDEESIRRSMTHSNVVINCIGREWPTRNFSLEDVNIHGPARLARIARESGVKRFVHISAINAREEPKKVFTSNGSNWLRTKWLGEQAVLEEFPDATIFRPCDLYGPEDSFLWHYFHWARQGFQHSMPLWKKGEYTIKSPLHFGDLAEAIVKSLDIEDAKGTVYEAYGPERYQLSELMDWMHLKQNKDPVDYNYRIVDLRFSPYVWFKAFVIGHVLPLGTRYYGRMTIDKLERTSLTDEILGLPNLTDLGVNAFPVTVKMPFEMTVLKAYGHYLPESVREDPFVPDPKPLTRLEEKAILAADSQSIPKMIGLE